MAGLTGGVFSERMLLLVMLAFRVSASIVEIPANSEEVADVILVVVRDEEAANIGDAAVRKVGRWPVYRAVATVEEQHAPVAAYRVGAEAVLDVENFEPHGMRSSVMGPTYQALKESL